MQRNGNGRSTDGKQLDEACRLLDGAMDVLARCADDPAALSVKRAAELIPELQALGRSTDPAHDSERG